jgi:hypothetical protein
MSCPKCRDARSVYCGACGSRIPEFSACPWCGSVNEADNSFCCSCGKRTKDYTVCPWCKAINDERNTFCGECGRSITFTPYPYSKHAITPSSKLLELLARRDVDHKTAARVASMATLSGTQCPNCGRDDEVFSVSHEAAVTPQRKFGVTAFATVLHEVLQGFGAEGDNLEEFASQKLQETWGWFCLTCGNGWLAHPEGGNS